ncbi:hypothetical protein GXW78_20785 [Roseomonas terrae]|uniref:Uncharacterized protein n=1 Tax=Neoroseomonas terrae TaxID=424799 RepID=A0ABS5EM51_9PROT|nr:hypothetical protein [Neoroseomonas terrae]MBR0652104.1 hypothetical protein [Neoroseomonas terrae]
MALEGLHLPRHAPWRQAFEAELVTFPAGKHDDQVDALGLIGQLLDQMVTGPAARPEPAPPKDSRARLFDRLNDGDVEGWKVA